MNRNLLRLILGTTGMLLVIIFVVMFGGWIWLYSDFVLYSKIMLTIIPIVSGIALFWVLFELGQENDIN